MVEAGEDKGRGTSLINQPALEIYLINVSLQRRARCQLARPSAYTNTDPRSPSQLTAEVNTPPFHPPFAHFFISLPIHASTSLGRIAAAASDRRVREVKGVASVPFSYRGNAGGRHRLPAALPGRRPFLLAGGAAIALNQEVSPAGGGGTPSPLDPERKRVK